MSQKYELAIKLNKGEFYKRMHRTVNYSYIIINKCSKRQLIFTTIFTVKRCKAES